MRDFWRGEEGSLAEFGNRFTGSCDLYQSNGRSPSASINFITAHDGFTLNDLVSYNAKHNEANQENNQDGENYNHSWNCGVEGESHDPEVLQLRERQRRNFLATLILSQGVPMLLMGDELGRTKNGNNNTYCQDNETSWLNWDLQESNADLLDFVRELIYFRHQHPVFRRRKWFQGRPIHGLGVSDIAWYNPDGAEMSEAQWAVGYAKSIAIFLNGEELGTTGLKGERVIDESFLLLFNAHYETIEFALPETLKERNWATTIDTKEARFVDLGTFYTGDQQVPVAARSLTVLRRLV
jgi:isoamylase